MYLAGHEVVFGIENSFDGIQYLDISLKNSVYGRDISIYRTLWYGIVWDTISRYIAMHHAISRRTTSKHQADTNSMKYVTGSRMNCNVTTVEGLPSSTGLRSSWQISQHSIIGVPLSGVAHQHARTPGISHTNIACISLETPRLQTQQTGAFRHKTQINKLQYTPEYVFTSLTASDINKGNASVKLFFVYEL